jgi:hypothetical protein
VTLKRYEAIHPEVFPNGTGVSVGTLDEGEGGDVRVETGSSVSVIEGVEQETMNNEAKNNETMDNEQRLLNLKPKISREASNFQLLTFVI